jgi:lipoteichoic acid synthase
MSSGFVDVYQSGDFQTGTIIRMLVVTQVARHIRHEASSRALIAGTALILALLLIFARIVILRADLVGHGVADAILLVMHGIFQDMVFVLCLTMVALGWSMLRRGARGMRSHVIVFMIVALLALVLGGVNITAVRILGEPLTIGWVKYSDLQNSGETLNSVQHLISLPLAAGAIAALLAFILLSAVLGAALDRKPALLSALPFLSFLALLVLFGTTQFARPITLGKLANPAFAFSQSLFAPDLDASQFAQGDDGQTDSVIDLVGTVAPSPRPDVPPGKIRNVIFYVMESTPAKYTEGFGGPFPVMPNLVRYTTMGRKFTNVYAHAPASNYFLVAAIAGIVPELSVDSMTYNHPDLRLETIGDVLTQQNYRAGFFSSADNSFQNTTAFMTAAKFDTVLDYKNWPCEQPLYDTDYDSGSDVRTAHDMCTIPPLTDWIDADPTRPFVAMVRTGMTHYPYFPGDNPQIYVENEDLNRYLNAVRVGDQAFGRMMDHLAEKGLLESTLVVVVGDHGEAFDEHGTIGHASAIYEENVHVPLMLINPVLFHGESSDVLAGVSDMAPTVLDLLGFAAPASWQGRSLFAERRPDAVLLFAPWNGFQLGFRQGHRKFIHNTSSGESWLFDLAVDPGETNNLAKTDATAMAQARRILAALVKNQLAHTARLLQAPGQDATEAVYPMPTDDTASTEIVLYATGTMFKTAPTARITIDGKPVGQISVTSAVSNADNAVSDALVDQSITAYRLPLEPHPCAKRVEIEFTNDEWEGENQTGDTDLYVQRLDIDGKSYWPTQFQLATDSAGGIKRDYFSMWRNGHFWIALTLTPTCLSDALTTP